MNFTKLTKSALAVALISCTLSACNSETSTSSDTQLFNGKDLTGWKQLTGTAEYMVEDGAIVGVMKKGSPNSFLATEKEYQDFILELDIKLDANSSNSGVQLRSHFDPEENDGKEHK